MPYGFNFFRHRSQYIAKYSLCLILSCTAPFVSGQTNSVAQNASSAESASTPPNQTLSDTTQNITSAQPTANPANPDTAKPNAVDPKEQLIKTSLSLLLVLILLLGLLWFMKRMGFGTGKRMGGFYRVLATSALGPKDKLVLIEIGDSWLLLGITSSSINTLHTMPAGSLDLNSEHKNTAEQFAKLLNRFNSAGKKPSETNKEPKATLQQEQA